jgi:hypothetical protein
MTHPIDRLATIRSTIKALAAQEKALLAEISALMGDADELVGDEFIARQSLTERKGSIDTAAIAAAGIDVESFRKAPVSVMTMRIEARPAAVDLEIAA